jgi:hypothetical protein
MPEGERFGFQQSLGFEGKMGLGFVFVSCGREFFAYHSNLAKRLLLALKRKY